jgi:hypothetical protein
MEYNYGFLSICQINMIFFPKHINWSVLVVEADFVLCEVGFGNMDVMM